MHKTTLKMKSIIAKLYEAVDQQQRINLRAWSTLFTNELR